MPGTFSNASCYAGNGTANTTFAPASPSPTAVSFTGSAAERLVAVHGGWFGNALVGGIVGLVVVMVI